MIEAWGLCKSFDGRSVLRGVSFRVPAGSCVALLGPSGAGKTVTLKHLVGLLSPDAGSVRIDGAPPTPEARLRVGYLFQHDGLLSSLSIAENVALPLREHDTLDEAEIRRRVGDLLEEVDLEDMADARPHHLSRGMLKRAGLARALVRNSPNLILDDPADGLDPASAARILDLVARVRHRTGAAVLVATHDPACASALADRTLHLTEGRILAEPRAVTVAR